MNTPELTWDHDSSIRLISIWAQDRNGLLGSGTDMLWHVPADFKHFKESTMGCPVIMGRASWEALGGALPGRTNIVITHNLSYDAPGAYVVPTIQEALDLGARIATDSGADTVWIAGGAQIYAATMGTVDELMVTHLDLEVDVADRPAVYAPEINPDHWMPCEPCSDNDWRPQSGDARWKVVNYIPAN